MNKFEVYTEGKVFDKWKSITINKTMETISGGFSMTAFYDYKSGGSPFSLSGQIMVSYNGALVMMGYIDTVNTSITTSGMNVEISGRDLTCDLIDCTIESTCELKNETVSSLVNKLASLYNIPVEENASAKKLQKKVEKKNQPPDEKIADTISSVCKKNGILPITNEAGVLVLEDKASGKMSSGLELSKNGNILSASHSANHAQRYTKITVLDNAESDIINLIINGGSEPLEGVAVDPIHKTSFRPRALTTIANNSGKNSTENLEIEANWKLAMSRASVSKISAKVQGWENADGELWRVNRLVDCDLKWIGLGKSEMLIKTVSFTIGEQGSFTNFELIHEDAYDDSAFTVTDEEKANALLKVSS